MISEAHTNPSIAWLLEGDVSIQYQTRRDLLGEERPDLQARIYREGWGAEFLARRKPSGHWGKSFYQPKWISTHYTLLDLKNLQGTPDVPAFQEAIDLILHETLSPDGGVNCHTGGTLASDVCVNGMFLNYAAYFGTEEKKLRSVVDFLLDEHMPDGGFNCRSNRSGARHSSLHTTLSVLEGIWEYERQGYTYRLDELLDAKRASEEFVLPHQLFLSDRTGEIIHKDFLRLSYPRRWKYNILDALDYFQASGHPRDARMQPAIDILLKKQNRHGTWNLQARHPGQTHFDMEQAGKPSRWNTLRVMRVLKWFGVEG